jgi:flagellar FliL protein
MATPGAPEAQAETPPAATPPPAGKRPVLLYAVIALVVLGGLGAGGWFLAPKLLGGGAKTAEAKAPEPVKATVSLGAVVVNLAGETRRYARVSVALGVASAKETKEVEEVKPQLLDLLIAVLGSAEAETMTSEDGRAELKEALLTRIHDELGLEKVTRVFFTEFVIQ